LFENMVFKVRGGFCTLEGGTRRPTRGEYVGGHEGAFHLFSRSRITLRARKISISSLLNFTKPVQPIQFRQLTPDKGRVGKASPGAQGGDRSSFEYETQTSGRGPVAMCRLGKKEAAGVFMGNGTGTLQKKCKYPGNRSILEGRNNEEEKQSRAPSRHKKK